MINLLQREAVDPFAAGLGDAAFHAIAQMVEARCGIRLPPSKRSMLEGRLRRRALATGAASLDDYVALLLHPVSGPAEWPHLVDAVTTNTTDFFREPAHYAFVAGTAIPQLLAGRPRARIKLWSAACSSGAEAYSAAMVLEDLRASGRGFDFSILGTDLSTDMVRRARAAIYPTAMMDSVPEGAQARYVMVSRDAGRDECRIVPQLRRRVSFHTFNLTEMPYAMDRDIDIVFCRNVLIYFARQTQTRVVAELAGHVRPDGYLLLGHAESTAATGVPGLRQITPSVFRVAPERAATGASSRPSASPRAHGAAQGRAHGGAPMAAPMAAR